MQTSKYESKHVKKQHETINRALNHSKYHFTNLMKPSSVDDFLARGIWLLTNLVINSSIDLQVFSTIVAN